MRNIYRAAFLPYSGFTDLVGVDTIKMSKRNINKKYNWVGLVPQIFETLAENLNFTFELEVSRDGNWGAQNKVTREWNGLIKDVIDDVADIAAAPLTVLESRSAVVDFLLPVQSDYNTFIIRKHSSYSWDLFFKPFHLSTWIIIFIFVISISFSQAFVVKLGAEKLRAEFDLEKCLIFVYGAFGGFAARRWSVTPNNTSAR